MRNVPPHDALMHPRFSRTFSVNIIQEMNVVLLPDLFMFFYLSQPLPPRLMTNEAGFVRTAFSHYTQGFLLMACIR